MLDEIATKLPHKMKELIFSLPQEERNSVTELRFRADRPVFIRTLEKKGFLQGQFIAASPSNCPIFRTSEISDAMLRFCGYSLYDRASELKKGYITLENGHRVGIAGKCGPNGITNPTSLIIRIARDLQIPIPGGVHELFPNYLPASILIVGEPGSGKTTLARFIAKQAASDPYYFHTVLIDERGELGIGLGASGGSIGICCDVLSGCNRTAGIRIAVRSLCPDLIVCDEIGGEDDIKALREAKLSGVDVIATSHGRYGSSENPFFKKNELFDLFDSVIVLGTREQPGTVLEIQKGGMFRETDGFFVDADFGVGFGEIHTEW